MNKNKKMLIVGLVILFIAYFYFLGGWFFWDNPFTLTTLIASIGVIIGFILIIVSGLSYLLKNRRITKRGDEAIKTLNTRYAKGEITKQEFEEMKKDIDS